MLNLYTNYQNKGRKLGIEFKAFEYHLQKALSKDETYTITCVKPEDYAKIEIIERFLDKFIIKHNIELGMTVRQSKNMLYELVFLLDIKPK
jgi:hypothetical protein